jgi:hypothetical protein
MAAADFFGTCQICGSTQKAHPHRIAKHGYTIRYGWQMGECYGSGAKPYEISNDRILEAIERAKRYIEQTKAQIATLKADPYEKDGTIFANVKYGRYDSEYVVRRVTLLLNEKGQIEAKDMDEKRVFLRDTGNAKTVAEAARAIADAQIFMLRSSIAQTNESIPYMQKRYDNWKAAELKPVTDADRAATKVKVHLAAKKWGYNTSVCVSSASAASAYKMTTTDPEKVTCAACLKEMARIADLPRQKAEAAEKERQRDIKRATSSIKEFTKLLKKATTDEDKLYYSRELTDATNTLNKLNAAAPADAAPATAAQ